MREADLQSLPSVRGTLRAGTLDGFDEGEGIAVGSRLAIKLGVAVGDKITLISPRGPETPFGVAPQVRAYPIAAVFQVGMSEIDAAVVFMPMAEAQDYFQVEDAVTAIEILVADPDSVEQYVPAIVEAASGPVRVSTWQETNRVYFNALQVERNVMFLILTLIVLVAALNIVSGMIMLVKDKGSDIAILRTMGATRGSIMRIFLLAGAAIGVVGTFAGFLLGIVFCANIESIRRFLSWLTNTELFSPELYFLSQLPAKVEPQEVVTVVVMALVLSLSATVYPSWRAARLDPVEALRYE
jgi:lipoprotein-releasing system permease protein